MAVGPTSVRPGREQHRSRWVLVAILAFLVGGLTVALLYHFNVFGARPTRRPRDPAYPRRRRVMSPHSAVSNSREDNVVIHVGEKQSVVVRADDDLVDNVTTEVQSGKLVIRTLLAASRRRVR